MAEHFCRFGPWREKKEEVKEAKKVFFKYAEIHGRKTRVWTEEAWKVFSLLRDRMKKDHAAISAYLDSI